MKCEKAQELFSDYLEGTLERPMEFMLEHHLEDCKPCQHDYERFCETWEALGALSEVEAPAGLRENIMMKVREQAEAKKQKAWGFDLSSIFKVRVPARPMAAAAAAVLFAVMAFRVSWMPVTQTDVWKFNVPEVKQIGDDGNYLVAPAPKTDTVTEEGLNITVSAVPERDGGVLYKISLKSADENEMPVKVFVTNGDDERFSPKSLEASDMVFNRTLHSGNTDSFLLMGKSAESKVVYVTWSHESKQQSKLILLTNK